MSSFKKLNKADVTSISYAANKRWTLSYTSAPNDDYIVYYVGRNEPFNINGSTTTNSQYQSLIYNQINHLFYQSYTNSLDTGSLMFNINTYESASQQRPTASYFNYNTNPLLIKNFPTGANDQIEVININQNIYGSKILPNNFRISQSIGLIIDDGNGNLYNVSNVSSNYISASYVNNSYFFSTLGNEGLVHIGNIFYAHGIIVLTNSNYFNILSTFPSTYTFENEHIIYENEVRCIVRESDYNLTYNPTITKYGGEYITSGSNGYTLTGSLDSTVKDFATGSDFQPYVTTIGLYNDTDDLLMVAKLAKPIMLSPDTDTTFIVRYDT
mgnify:CR=1 FL=1